jgi:formylglycine-generating enzyme required for sulfatase activity
MDPPRCFVSYSWDGEQHRQWVRTLATRLIESGIDVILDQFECAPGTDLTKFMEKSVRESSFVLLVCTPNFAQKADAGVGGVGYEKAIVTGEIFAGGARETKFVPLLREGDAKKSLPSYLHSRLFIDFREDGLFETRLTELLRHFYGEPLYPKPPIGRKPDWQQPTISEPAKKPYLQRSFKNTIGMKFVLISAGRFEMGGGISPEKVVRRYGGEAKWFRCEYPRHEVKIEQPFYLQTTPVTQNQWRCVMGKNPSNFSDCGDDCPVEWVSWDDVQEFIKKLNEKEYTDRYLLPTEAEWEYACRAGSTTEYFFGDDVHTLSDYAWYSANSSDLASYHKLLIVPFCCHSCLIMDNNSSRPASS